MKRCSFAMGIVAATGLLSLIGCDESQDYGPVAVAGTDRTVLEGDTVTLDGSSSSDMDGDSLTYLWSLQSVPTGSTAVLDDAASVTPSFVADLQGTYEVRLVVSDGHVDSYDETTVIGMRCPIGMTWDGNDCSTADTLAYFPLDGNLDDSGGTYSGALGSGSFVPGVDHDPLGALRGPMACSSNYAARVDGFPDLPASFTVEACIFVACPPESWQGNLAVAKWDNGYAGPGFVLFAQPDPYGGSDYIFSFVLNGQEGYVAVTPEGGIKYPCGAWYHVAGVREAGATARLFVNGVEVGTGTDTAGSIANVRPLTLSGHTPEAGGCGWGMSRVDLDDVAIYAKALSSLEIKGHAASR